MYEDVTFDIIMQRMLTRVPDDVDKIEGSIIYDALAPAAAELQRMYIELDVTLNESFADTQSREFLMRRCAERGIHPYPATKAILQAEFNIEVDIGERFTLGSLTYVVKSKISEWVYQIECETAGSIGNRYFGNLIPVEFIDGLTSAVVTALLIPGDDEEETEHLRERYLDSFFAKAFGGNKADYKQKTKELNGVGGVKITPIWQGGGTVRSIIIDSTFKVPSTALVNYVQIETDPVGHQGEGLGFAPIGHVVTVQGVTATVVNITSTITYQEGWNWEAIRPQAEKAIDDYFLELAKSWEDETNLVVRISQIELRLLGINGVIDIADATINGATQNLTLGENNIPVRGNLSG